MGLHPILENEHHCQTKCHSKSINSSQHQCSGGEERGGKKKSTGMDYLMKNLNADFKGVDLDSPYRRSMPSKPVGMDVQDETIARRRGSVYQSSTEVRKSKNLQEDRRSTRFHESNEDFISFKIVNSSLRSEDQSKSSGQKKRLPPIPSNKTVNSTSMDASRTVLTNSPDFLDLSFRFLPDEKGATSRASTLLPSSPTIDEDKSDDFLEIHLSTEKFSCRSTTNHEKTEASSSEACTVSRNDGKLLTEWDDIHFQSKTLSAKSQASLNQPADDALREGPKSWFGFGSRRGMDPIINSNSQRNPLPSEAEILNTPTKESIYNDKNKVNFTTAKSGSSGSSIMSRNDNNLPSESGNSHFLSKSLSAKIGMQASLNQPVDDSVRESPKSWFGFGTRRRMLDPVMRSKSQRNPSPSEAGTIGAQTNVSANIKKNKAFNKSILNDFSSATQQSQKMENDVLTDTREQKEHGTLSPIHLSGILKLERKNGVTSAFEFLPDNSEEFFSAKAWRTTSAINWVYTFTRNKKKTCGNTRDGKGKYNPPSIIGQMQVSCYLCSEINNNQNLENSIVMECTLYDVAQARRRLVSEGKSPSPAGAIQSLKPTTDVSVATAKSNVANDFSSLENSKVPSRSDVGDEKLDACDSHPLAPADLLPNFEVAAIVIQFPYEIKGSLRNRKEHKARANGNPNSCNLDITNHDKKSSSNCLFSSKMKVITPSGSHGLPCKEGCPSPLLDRWRSAGGCDCGGWDMGCPIVVFESTNHKHQENTAATQQSLTLFAQGARDNLPDLTMTHEERQYKVQFHAKFSALQAFSICVAMLHSWEPSIMISQDASIPTLHTKSLKLLLEEEVRHLLGAVADKEKAKKANVEQLPSYYVLDPPFSPIGRV